MLVPVANKTYKMFAKRYGIKLYYKRPKHIDCNGNCIAYSYTRKSIFTIRQEIKEYEFEHNITNGLYF
jgi:hypothetical protein